MIHLANLEYHSLASLPLRPPPASPSKEDDDLSGDSASESELYSDSDSDWDEPLEQVLRFTTLAELDDHRPDLDEKAKCLKRGKNACIFMDTPDPVVCHIIPYSWNDTKEHNNATGGVKRGGGSLLSFNIDLDALHICNPLELGATDKSWNMISLDRELYDRWSKGHCAFKCLGFEVTEGGGAKVTLQFWWMPQTKRRCGQAIDIVNTNDDNDWYALIEELKEFHARGNPPSTLGDEANHLVTKSGASLQSGYLIYLQIPEQGAVLFKQAMEIQWASILFTSLSGAAGSPELMFLGDPENGYENY
ncbi:hypothetical protein ACHAPU_004621 [Fusarium lateritium]